MPTTKRRGPEAVADDTGDSSSDRRNWLAEREIEVVIAKRDDEMPPNDYDRNKRRERPKIEQTINRHRRFRRIATPG